MLYLLDQNGCGIVKIKTLSLSTTEQMIFSSITEINNAKSFLLSLFKVDCYMKTRGQMVRPDLRLKL